LLVRLWSFLDGPRLDDRLADGISPTTSVVLAARADWITNPRSCRTVAQALRGAVDAADRPPDRGLHSRVPVEAGAIQVCRENVLALAETLSTAERPPAYGVAISRQLAFHGGSPLFLQGPDRRHGADGRLACTLHAAQRGLEVLPTSTPSQLSTSTKKRKGVPMTEANREGGPVVNDDIGAKDLRLAFTMLGVPAFIAVALGIILSLT
jgi:hypothetical protein